MPLCDNIYSCKLENYLFYRFAFVYLFMCDVFFLYLISCKNSDSTRKTIFWQSSTRNGQLSPKQCLWFCQWATNFVLLYLVYWHSFDHEKVSAMAFVLTKTPISLEFDMLAVFCKLFLKYIKISWGSIDQIVTNWWIKKIHFAKNKQLLAKVRISTIQIPRAGPTWGAFQLFRVHFLATYGYFAQLTLFWAKMYALVAVHQRYI